MNEDLHNRWPHRWLSPKAEARDSEIHGLGVFAVESISKGEAVGVLGGIVVPRSEIKDYWDAMGHVGIQIDDDFFIVPSSRQELKEKGVFNHSCEPNLGYSNSITLAAIRDIKQGEELVFDYAFSESYHKSFPCSCGNTNCRKEIGPEDWKLPELQEKYKEYFSPYLKVKL